jgi:hypothetical protein
MQSVKETLWTLLQGFAAVFWTRAALRAHTWQTENDGMGNSARETMQGPQNVTRKIHSI